MAGWLACSNDTKRYSSSSIATVRISLSGQVKEEGQNQIKGYAISQETKYIKNHMLKMLEEKLDRLIKYGLSRSNS
jgi:uncharacterized protein YggE